MVKPAFWGVSVAFNCHNGPLVWERHALMAMTHWWRSGGAVCWQQCVWGERRCVLESLPREPWDSGEEMTGDLCYIACLSLSRSNQTFGKARVTLSLLFSGNDCESFISEMSLEACLHYVIVVVTGRLCQAQVSGRLRKGCLGRGLSGCSLSWGQECGPPLHQERLTKKGFLLVSIIALGTPFLWFCFSQFWYSLITLCWPNLILSISFYKHPILQFFVIVRLLVSQRSNLSLAIRF